MKIAPLFEDIAFGPKGGAAHWVTTSDGVRIRVANWTHAGAKGTILLFPGRTEYIEKYGDAAREFAAGGYATVAIDWRGQGLADRLLPRRAPGHVGEFADYQTDLAAVMEHVEALDLPKPYYLVAHSLGGCIGLQALIEGLPVNAAAFSAPMWGITLEPAILRPISWAISWIGDLIGLGHKIVPTQSDVTYVLREDFEPNTLTRDEDMWNRLVNQMKSQPDLAIGGPTLHWLNKSLREMRRLTNVPSPLVPTVTFLGTSEEIVSPARIKERMAEWPNGTLHIIENGEHEVMLEIPESRTFVYKTIIAHFHAHA
jgi:lysophospholipase